MVGGTYPQDSDDASARRNIAASRWQVVRRHVEDGEPLTQIAQDTGLALRTVQRWHATYRRDGIAGLIPAVPLKRGRRTHPELQLFIEGLALTKPQRSIAAIARKAQTKAAQEDWPTVSYNTVRSIIRALDQGMVMLAHHGPVAYRDHFELAWRHRADRANATWQADHTQLDILIMDANDQPVRPWLTVILDDYSRAVCGYMVFVGAPSARNTALALRQAIWSKHHSNWPMCGIPDVRYVDHGPDFTSGHLAQTARDLHFEIIYSTIARPQGRGKIERIFGTINTELLTELPGYITEGHRHPAPVLTLAELDAAIGAFIADNYHQRNHPELDQTPQQTWLGDG